MTSRRVAPLPAGWPATRLRILERDGYMCQLCPNKAAHVDHIVPASSGSKDNSDTNLQSLCATCHMRKTGREAQRLAPRLAPRKRPLEAHPGMSSVARDPSSGADHVTADSANGSRAASARFRDSGWPGCPEVPTKGGERCLSNTLCARANTV